MMKCEDASKSAEVFERIRNYGRGMGSNNIMASASDLLQLVAITLPMTTLLVWVMRVKCRRRYRSATVLGRGQRERLILSWTYQRVMITNGIS